MWGEQVVTTKPVSIGRIVPDKTETHVESIPANVFIRENLRPIDAGFVVLGGKAQIATMSSKMTIDTSS